MPPTASPAPDSREKTASKAEWGLAILGVLILCALKWVYIWALKVNSDEPQHLHIAWAWTQGLVQYRDIFDNHTPLFHLISAPFVALLGERADILFYMRLFMVPLCLGSLACIYLITRRLYDQRAAFWAALLAGLHPFYLLISTEYRTDNFWALCWFIALLLMLTGKATARRFFCVGLVLGAAFSVSMKTSLLLLSFGIGGVLVWGAQIWAGDRALLRTLGRNALATVGGLVIIPLILLAYFATEGALDEMYYCVFEHNIVPGMKPKGRMDRWDFPTLFPLIVAAGWLFYRTAPDRYTGTRRAIAAMGACFSMSLLMAYWPLVTRQDFAAITPPFLISAAPLLMAIVSRIRKAGAALIEQNRKVIGRALVLLSLSIPVGAIAYEVEGCNDIWRWSNEGLVPFNRDLATQLELSEPDEYIFDPKGQTIFRKRAYYYVLERVTLTRLKKGMMPDTLYDDVLDKDASMIIMASIPSESKRRIPENYIRVTGSTWLAGKYLQREGDPKPDGPYRFNIPIPNEYTFLTPNGKISGTLDGLPISGPVELSEGDHEFIPDTPVDGPLMVILSRALEHGFDPFHIPVKTKVKSDEPQQVILTNPFSKKRRWR